MACQSVNQSVSLSDSQSVSQSVQSSVFLLLFFSVYVLVCNKVCVCVCVRYYTFISITKMLLSFVVIIVSPRFHHNHQLQLVVASHTFTPPKAQQFTPYIRVTYPTIRFTAFLPTGRKRINNNPLVILSNQSNCSSY